MLDLGWAHKPLKGYQSLIDGLTPLCTCGSDECIRQYLSRKGLERQYHQLSLQHCTASEIIQNVDQNQAWSTRIYRIWIDQLARALSDAIIHFKPKLLILSGGLIQHPDLALTLRSALSRYCLSEVLPKIECLNNEGYDFAKGSVSMYTVNCAQLPTFTS
ncbi:N-acetyl-D-glucosamine kinase [Vibrio cholerae]|nr:N-acetyl-D-glucosamine kinase [Vibrio cholerae]